PQGFLTGALMSVLLVLGSDPKVAADESALDQPEVELAKAAKDLDRIVQEANASRNLPQTQTAATLEYNNNNLYSSAMEAFKKNLYLTTVRELERYLNQAQYVDLPRQLVALTVMGESYEKLGFNSAAANSYKNYLATATTADPMFVTSKDFLQN